MRLFEASLFDTAWGAGKGASAVGDCEVSDVVVQIQRQIMLWTDVAAEGINLIVTTGGTGFATSDNTPEVRILTFIFFSFRCIVDKRSWLPDHRLSRLCCTSRPLVLFTACWMPLSALRHVSNSKAATSA